MLPPHCGQTRLMIDEIMLALRSPGSVSKCCVAFAPSISESCCYLDSCGIHLSSATASELRCRHLRFEFDLASPLPKYERQRFSGIFVVSHSLCRGRTAQVWTMFARVPRSRAKCYRPNDRRWAVSHCSVPSFGRTQAVLSKFR
jgi:hypothetical protein